MSLLSQEISIHHHLWTSYFFVIIMSLQWKAIEIELLLECQESLKAGL